MENFNGYNALPVEKPTTLYEQHESAVIEFRAACHDLLKASQRREAASAQLQKITQCLAESIKAAMQDPTAPQQTNGHAMGQAAQQISQRAISGF